MAVRAKSGKQPIVVVGGGGHGKVLLGVLERLPRFKVLGYLDPEDRGPLLGHRHLGGDELLPQLARKHRRLAAALGVGKVRAESPRFEILARLERAGMVLPVIVAPSALVARDAEIGAGTVVFDGAVIQPGCRLGRGVIVNTRAVLDHDCTLGDDVHVATGAVLSGAVSVGSGSFIGAGAACRNGIVIAAGCTIGAGAVVAGDCREAGVYAGVPARRQVK